MKASWSLLVIAGLGLAGCATDEPRQLERGGQDELGQASQEEGAQQRDRAGGGTIQQGGGPQGGGQQQALLDGKVYQVELQDAKEGKTIPDTLIFARGTFDSTACRQYGFSAVPYQANREADGSIRFSALATAGEARNQWNGVVRGTSIEGTLSMQKPGEEAAQWPFRGQLASPAASQQGGGMQGQQGQPQGQIGQPRSLNEEDK